MILPADAELPTPVSTGSSPPFRRLLRCPRPPREKPVGGALLRRSLPGMMPNKTPRKPWPPDAAPAGAAVPDRRGHRARQALPAAPAAGTKPEAVVDCALQLRKMGDKLNLRQRILNLIAKLLCPRTQECLE